MRNISFLEIVKAADARAIGGILFNRKRLVIGRRVTESERVGGADAEGAVLIGVGRDVILRGLTPVFSMGDDRIRVFGAVITRGDQADMFIEGEPALGEHFLFKLGKE